MIDPEEFFATPLSTSRLKYKILNRYFREYFHKINQHYKSRAVVADLFAGKGRFDSGEEGSPIILANYAKIARDIYGYKNKVILSEKIPKIRGELFENIREFVIDDIVTLIDGDAKDAGENLLKEIPESIPLFVLLDPFGIKGLSMDLLKKILARAKTGSVEILINFNHLALRRVLGKIKNVGTCKSAKLILDEVLGGDWWEEIYQGTDNYESETDAIIGEYIRRFESFIPHIGILPVTKGFPDENIRYHLIFGTKNLVAFELMNNSMKNAYDALSVEITRNNYAETLFSGIDQKDLIPSKYKINIKDLSLIVYEELRAYFAGIFTRLEIRTRMIKKYFAKYESSDYNKAIKLLYQDDRILKIGRQNKISDTTDLILSDQYYEHKIKD